LGSSEKQKARNDDMSGYRWEKTEIRKEKIHKKEINFDR
jgi:hypothetical protein